MLARGDDQVRDAGRERASEMQTLLVDGCKRTWLTIGELVVSAIAESAGAG